MWVAAAFFVGALWTSHAASISKARGFRNNIPKQFTGIPSSYYGGLPILPVQLIPLDSYNGHYTHMPFLNYFPLGQDGTRAVGSKDAMIPYLNEDNADGDSSEYGGAVSGARAMRDSSEGDEDVVKTKDTAASGARGLGDDGEHEGLSKKDGLGDAKSKDFAVHVTDNYGVDNSSYDEVPDPKGLGDADSSYAEDEDILKTYDGAASGARALKGATPSKAEKAEDSSEGSDDADSTKSEDDEDAAESEDAAASGARGLGDADSSKNEDEEDTLKSEGSDDADSSKSDDDEDTSKSEDAAASGARGLGDADSSKSEDDEDTSKSEDAAPSGARGLGDANSSKSEEDKDTSKSEGSNEADSSKSENDEDAAKSEDAAVSGARGLGDADSSKSDDDEDSSKSEDAAASGARGLGDSDSSKNDDDEDDSKSEDAAASGAKGLGDANSSKSEEDNKDTSKSEGDAKSSKSEEEEDSSKSEGEPNFSNDDDDDDVNNPKVAAASGARGQGDTNSGEGGDDVEGSGDTNSSNGDDEDAATTKAPESSTAASTPAGASKNSGARALSDPRLEQLDSLPKLSPSWGSFGRIYNNAPIAKLGGLYPDSLFGFPRIYGSPFRPFGKYDIPFGAVPIPSYMHPYGPQQMQIFRRLGRNK